MNLRTSTSVFVAVAALVVVAALASTLSVSPAGSVTTVEGPTSAYATSSDGLRLTLQVSSSGISQGGSLLINVTETNTNLIPLNVSATHKWPVQGLKMSSCYASVYPFGVAVYEGHQTLGSVAAADRLNLYPMVPCPLLIRYISGYFFQSDSASAVVLPGDGTPMPMTASLAAAGNYTSGETRTPFTPGDYTVVAGDEWGSVVLLYFTVR